MPYFERACARLADFGRINFGQAHISSFFSLRARWCPFTSIYSTYLMLTWQHKPRVTRTAQITAPRTSTASPSVFQIVCSATSTAPPPALHSTTTTVFRLLHVDAACLFLPGWLLGLLSAVSCWLLPAAGKLAYLPTYVPHSCRVPT